MFTVKNVKNKTNQKLILQRNCLHLKLNFSLKCLDYGFWHWVTVISLLLLSNISMNFIIGSLLSTDCVKRLDPM